MITQEKSIKHGSTTKWQLENKREFSIKKLFLSWEMMLVGLLIGIMIMNAHLSPHFLNVRTIIEATRVFLDGAFLVFPMVLIIILGGIDISVGSTVALTSVIMGVTFDMGVPMPVAILIALLVGVLCGFINGVLIVKFKELSPVIVTLGTMITFRGIAYVILENQSVGGFPNWFSHLGWGNVMGIPVMLIAFMITAIAFSLLLHRTNYGRHVYATGKNEIASRFSGVNTDRVKIIAFVLAGLMAAIAGLFLTSRMGSTRPNIASNYELEAIAMVALGGVSTAGGKGKMFGPIICVFIIGYLQFGLGVVNVSSQTLMIIIGLLLIVSVSIPKVGELLRKKRK